MFKKLWKKLVRKIWIYRIDRNWDFTTGACFQLLPPSFYSTHTDEEIKDIQRRMYKIIDECDCSEKE